MHQNLLIHCVLPQILSLLNDAHGSVLEDESLINALSTSKSTSNQVKDRVAASEKTQRKLQTMREAYQDVAVRGGCLYFCLADLAIVEPMYQFSLEWFNTIFRNALAATRTRGGSGGGEGGEDDDDSVADEARAGALRRGHQTESTMEERLQALKKACTLAVYQNVCRSLFEKDKLLFSFLMTVRVCEAEQGLDHKLVQYVC